MRELVLNKTNQRAGDQTRLSSRMFTSCKMASRTFLLCLLISLLTVSYIECRGGSRGSSSRGSSSRGSSSWGSSSHGSSWSKPSSSSSSWSSWSKPSSSSSSWSKPSSSSSSWSKPSSSWSYPSSSSGLSGSGSSYKPSSSSGSSWSYPSSSSGLSGTGSSWSYPSSSSGLSGSGSSSYNKPSSSSGSSWSYPSSSSGLSGSGSSSYNKPSSSSGSWNSGSKYPTSSTGLSGSNSGSSYKPPSGSGSATYPFGTGLSGSNSNNNYKPTNTYNTNSGTHTVHTNHYYHHNTVPYGVPTYYTAPQYVYVHEYRNSNSRYGDLLTGLSLYNLGRSHSHYHDHYYYDDYYRRRYDNPSSSSFREESRPKDQANCILKVNENGREEVLKIPCEIVSTFTQDSKKVAPSQKTQVNKTVCTTTITTINNTVSSSAAPAVQAAPVSPVLSVLPAATLNSSSINSTTTAVSNKTEPAIEFNTNGLLAALNHTLPSGSSVDAIMAALEKAKGINGAFETVMKPTTPNNVSFANSTVASNSSTVASNSSLLPLVNSTVTLPVNGSSGSVTKITTVNATTVNVTVCTTNSSLVDPLTVKGPAVNVKNMKCVVEIQTRDAFLSNDIDCSTLIAYAKIPEPKKDTGILPPREKLKTWLANPPWWMSLFIAV